MVSTHIAIFDWELNFIAQVGGGSGKNIHHTSLPPSYPTLSTEV